MSDKLININSYPVKALLPYLLKDKTTKRNIIWATDNYGELGPAYKDTNSISPELLSENGFILQPRVSKTIEAQKERTKKKAEVATPVFLSNIMNNYLDTEWFGRENVFNTENKEDNTWIPTEGKIIFPEGKTWKDYIKLRKLEITCGEAPFIVSRYDTVTGELIIPAIRRVGLLDRKLRIVNENTHSEAVWMDWALESMKNTYGYEWSGDSLLIARINCLLTVWEYYTERWGKEPEMKDMRVLCNIICWNIWQMDGLTDKVPEGKPFSEFTQISVFGEEEKEPEKDTYARIYHWGWNKSMEFRECKGE